MPQLAGRARVYAYDFTTNEVPGVRIHEERCYWRDVGTLEALAAAQNDVRGAQPRFNLTNYRWPIHGESHAALVHKIQEWNRRTGRIEPAAPMLTAYQAGAGARRADPAEGVRS
jgi:ADP-glucose pyrophosphorylase